MAITRLKLDKADPARPKRTRGRPSRLEKVRPGTFLINGRVVREVIDIGQGFVEFVQRTTARGPGVKGLPRVVTAHAFSTWMAREGTDILAASDADWAIDALERGEEV